MTLIIAEAGVNHDGSQEIAHRLVDAAADAGADVVKFQTFSAAQVVTRAGAKAPYQAASTGAGEGQLEMLSRLELPAGAFGELAAHCRERGIAFLSTPFDLPSLERLVTLGMSMLKVPSGEITNPFLLGAVAQTQLPVLLSTGMSTLGEVEAALAILAAVYLGEPLGVAPPVMGDRGREILRSRVTLLHCTTAYPTLACDVNLRAMATLSAAFRLPVGFSDHTLGLVAPVCAVALGATVVEKHFTLDRSRPGPDHQASLEPAELAELVRSIRTAEEALGRPGKGPAPSELANRAVARRSLVAAAPIRRGEPFTLENLTAKRPASGVSPMRLHEWLGKLAQRDFAPDDLIG
jgi:N-acetylneuraminate synthase